MRARESHMRDQNYHVQPRNHGGWWQEEVDIFSGRYAVVVSAAGTAAVHYHLLPLTREDNLAIYTRNRLTRAVKQHPTNGLEEGLAGKFPPPNVGKQKK